MSGEARVALVVLFALSACGGAAAESANAEEPAPIVSADPDWDDAAARAAFEDLESRLSAASSVRVEFETLGEGAVRSATRGVLETREDNRVQLEVAGEFQGRPIAPTLESDGSSMAGGDTAGRFEQETPRGLNDALLVGLSRMGLLHNIATLAGGAPPDRADGSVREWVTTSHHRAAGQEVIGGVRTKGVGFMISVAGAPAAEATLHLDAETLLPVERRQTVRFEDGEMRVVERYTVFSIDDE